MITYGSAKYSGKEKKVKEDQINEDDPIREPSVFNQRF